MSGTWQTLNKYVVNKQMSEEISNPQVTPPEKNENQMGLRDFELIRTGEGGWVEMVLLILKGILHLGTEQLTFCRSAIHEHRFVST